MVGHSPAELYAFSFTAPEMFAYSIIAPNLGVLYCVDCSGSDLLVSIAMTSYM